jgi:hypothetical protein
MSVICPLVGWSATLFACNISRDTYNVFVNCGADIIATRTIVVSLRVASPPASDKPKYIICFAERKAFRHFILFVKGVARIIGIVFVQFPLAHHHHHDVFLVTSHGF